VSSVVGKFHELLLGWLLLAPIGMEKDLFVSAFIDGKK